VNVLVADDNPQNLYLMQVMLAGRDHVVTPVSNGAEALDLLAAAKFDLVISDILMPKIDGFELCRLVKSDPRFREVPFVLYSATYVDREDEAFARKLGADAFLLKPMEPDDFLEAIDRIVRDRETSTASPSAPHPEPEVEFLREHADRLSSKLEDKQADLDRADDEVGAREIQFQTLAQLVTEGVFRCDAAGSVDYANDRWRDMVGMPAGHVGAWDWIAGVEAADREQIGALWHDSLRRGQPFRAEFTLVRPGRAPAPILGRIEPLADQGGAISVFVGVFIDRSPPRAPEPG